jgi:hypothetical protein
MGGLVMRMAASVRLCVMSYAKISFRSLCLFRAAVSRRTRPGQGDLFRASIKSRPASLECLLNCSE